MSFTTFDQRMEDIKPENPSHYSWQQPRHALPMPSRSQHPYDSVPSTTLPYHGSSKPIYHPPPAVMPIHLPSSPRPRDHPVRPPLTTHHSYPSLKRSHSSSFSPPSPPKSTPDHRLLTFAPQPNSRTILDPYNRPVNIDVAAQIHGMFFLSELASPTGDSPHTHHSSILQPELTCYRRNLFQISGSVTHPNGPLSLLTEHNSTVPITDLSLHISASESVDGHPIRLIVIPWKTPPPNADPPPATAESDPPAIPLVSTSTSELTVQQIAWRRLQFRVATANNGRRKELQQHFLLHLKVMASLPDGARVVLCESMTTAIVVRGRSPRNFQARREIPLVGAGASARGRRVDEEEEELEEIRRGPGRLELPKRGWAFDASHFPPSPLGARPGYPPHSQWHPPTTSSTTPTHPYPPAVSYLPPHPSTHSGSHPAPSQQGHPSAPPSTASASLSPSSHPSHTPLHHPSQTPTPYYHSPHATVPSTVQSTPIASHPQTHFLDNNPRPLKSPRHHSDTTPGYYPGFEDRMAGPFSAPVQGPREYFPVWTSAPEAPAEYASAGAAGSGYAYQSAGFVKSEGEGEAGSGGQHYTWSSAQ